MKVFLSALIVSFLIISCDRPQCKNINPVFDENSIESEEYKSELASILLESDQASLTFWLNKYIENESGEFVSINIQNDSLCAIGVFEVENWKGLEGYRKTKGVSYIGAEIRGLQFDISKEESGTHFIYKSLDRIID